MQVQFHLIKFLFVQCYPEGDYILEGALENKYEPNTDHFHLSLCQIRQSQVNCGPLLGVNRETFAAIRS